MTIVIVKMSISKVKIAVLENLLIFGEEYLPQIFRLLDGLKRYLAECRLNMHYPYMGLPWHLWFTFISCIHAEMLHKWTIYYIYRIFCVLYIYRNEKQHQFLTRDEKKACLPLFLLNVVYNWVKVLRVRFLHLFVC